MQKSNSNSSNRYKYFKTSSDKILSWLVWLKNYNRHYTYIIIDYNALYTLSCDCSMHNNL